MNLLNECGSDFMFFQGKFLVVSLFIFLRDSPGLFLVILTLKYMLKVIHHESKICFVY